MIYLELVFENSIRNCKFARAFGDNVKRSAGKRKKPFFIYMFDVF